MVKKHIPFRLALAFVVLNASLAALALNPPTLAALIEPFARRAQAPAATPRVIHISVDGLGAHWFKQLRATQPLPAFGRLMREGAWTLNARPDYDWTVTLPNHTGMLTGRPVNDKLGTVDSGHHWTNNGGFAPGTTLHSNAGYYVPSVFDVLHDNGRSTALFASKDKFSIYRDSYDANNGAPDVTGDDNGHRKIDAYVNYDLNSTAMMTDLIAALASAPADYTFVHFHDADTAGHRYGWGSSQYNAAVTDVDTKLAELLAAIDASDALRGNTWIVLSADHGGRDLGHSDQTEPLSYAIPLIVWGPDAAPDTDLYALNTGSALDPGSARVDFSASDDQPLRNTDTGNCALRILGLPTLAGALADSLVAPCTGGGGASAPFLTPLRSGAAWRYRDALDAPASNWASSAFDDSAWLVGASSLGYGDPVVTTLTAPPDCQRAVAAYARTAFRLPEAAAVTSATLMLRRDDGAVVFLNGLEITRSNMPGGAISHTTLAAGAISGADELAWHAQSVPPEAFARGANTIAVSLHQSDACSSDITFDLELRVATQADPATPTRTDTPEPTPSATVGPAQRRVWLPLAVQTSR